MFIMKKYRSFVIYYSYWIQNSSLTLQWYQKILFYQTDDWSQSKIIRTLHPLFFSWSHSGIIVEWWNRHFENNVIFLSYTFNPHSVSH